MRIYTRMGKENIHNIETFGLFTDNHILRIFDNTEAESIKHVINAGQPCCIQIYYTDSDVNINYKLEGCFCNELNEIQYETANLST